MQPLSHVQMADGLGAAPIRKVRADRQAQSPGQPE